MFKRVVGEGELASPTAFCPIDDLLFVVEFKPPRITVLDRADRVVTRLFEDAAAPSKPGWPNAEGPAGEPVRSPTLRPEVLNRPHAIAADSQGNVYLTEWLIGGRRPKLQCVR